MSSTIKKSIRRADFVRQLAQNGSLTYLEAERAYALMLRTLENALAAHSTVSFGRLGVLQAKELPPRRVAMNCKRTGGPGGGKTEIARSEFFLGQRTRYVFRVHRAFGRKHGLS